mgnify:FL=1
MNISVVVPAFNEEKLLSQTLERIQSALEAFHALGWGTEIVVCDNNSTDRTAALAQEAGAKVVFEPINQISRARNRGAEAASGDWLIFVDADSHPSRELFAAVARSCLAGGSTVRMDGAPLAARAVTALWNAISRAMRWCAGSFIFCEAKAFRQAGGFSLELFASEEIDLSGKLKKLARQQGRRVVILRRHPLVTSARKLRLYSARTHLRLLLRTLLRPTSTLRSREACGIWYDGKR